MGRKPGKREEVLRMRPVSEQGPAKAHRLEGKVENRGLRSIKKQAKHAK